MQAMDDMALLREYATNRSEDAFAELVSRRLNFVHSAALRQVRDPSLAQEVTQAVFVILAQKAEKISDKTILAGWLFRTTRFAALAQMRAEAKRRQREAEAQMQTEIESSAPDEFWSQISPQLDEALAGLGENDRQAVLLRYFENKSMAEVGAALHAGEDAARKRVGRALEKLRKFFAKRGVASTTAIIAVALTANSVQAAPTGLATTITAAAVKGPAAAATSTLALVKGTLKIMTYAKLKLALGIAAAALLAAGTVNVALSSMTDDDKTSAGQPTEQETKYATEIMKSIADDDYHEFVADGDKNFKSITKAQFQSLCDQDTSQLKNGYHVIFLGALTQDGGRITLWKVSHIDGTDDDLLHLAIAHGKISGALVTYAFQ
jgi:RNA polymerase sigma factor (sigma-70 family)